MNNLFTEQKNTSCPTDQYSLKTALIRETSKKCQSKSRVTCMLSVKFLCRNNLCKYLVCIGNIIIFQVYLGIVIADIYTARRLKH